MERVANVGNLPSNAKGGRGAEHTHQSASPGFALLSPHRFEHFCKRCAHLTLCNARGRSSGPACIIPPSINARPNPQRSVLFCWPGLSSSAPFLARMRVRPKQEVGKSSPSSQTLSRSCTRLFAIDRDAFVSAVARWRSNRSPARFFFCICACSVSLLCRVSHPSDRLFAPG
jgi:hypothetical protein